MSAILIQVYGMIFNLRKGLKETGSLEGTRHR